MSRAERILVRSVNWLGDAVMSTSALLRLREARPNATITILCQDKLADLWKHQPFADDVITFSKDEGPWQIGRKLRARKFDSALILPNSLKSALEAWLGRIPVRVGIARPWRSWMLTKAVSPPPEETRMRKRSLREIQARIAAGTPRQPFPESSHHIHMYLHLVAAGFGAVREPLAPRITVDQAEVECVRKKFGLAETVLPTVGINAGAEYGPAKRWPAERFIEFALRVHKKANCRWVLFGGKADVDLAGQIARGIQAKGVNAEVISLTGRTTLRELCAAFRVCSCVITNDTGPMHVAAAVGTTVIVPFGSTSPELTGPGLPSRSTQRLVLGQAPCAPCFLRECPIDFRCLSSISAEIMANEALAVLQRS